MTRHQRLLVPLAVVALAVGAVSLFGANARQELSGQMVEYNVFAAYPILTPDGDSGGGYLTPDNS